jgi:hypothetical protein
MGMELVSDIKGALRVLRRIFGLKRDEEIGFWRTFHNERLHNFYS